mmetsp:Transcript_25909/g.61173  ORF Transcript_25909/g.61173 Transcript_25909/m.61173 type:complete len:108 (-) Transcript_25909:118-441(-)
MRVEGCGAGAGCGWDGAGLGSRTCGGGSALVCRGFAAGCCIHAERSTSRVPPAKEAVDMFEAFVANERSDRIEALEASRLTRGEGGRRAAAGCASRPWCVMLVVSCM